MCRIEYTKYLPCGCEFYEGHKEWCERFLKPYPHHGRKDAPEWEKTLIIQKADEHGIFKRFDHGITYKTMPKDPDNRIARGCEYTKYIMREKQPMRKCLYCKPGGMKEKLDNKKRRQEKVEAEGAGKAQKAQDGDGCCIVQ